MTDTSDSVLAFRPSPQKAAEIIRKLAADSRNVAWSIHALERMLERDITDEMALAVLRNGYVAGEVVPGQNAGEWKVKMTKDIKGRREIGVVTLIIRAQRLLVKTAEWEDIHVR
jgi:hypothetical protein